MTAEHNEGSITNIRDGVKLREEVTLRPLGYIRSPYRDKSDAPHQPDPSEGAEAVIELEPGMNFEQALEDLDGMEKLWLIYWFDRNPNWKPKVLVPRGPAKKRGVFATRSPHRPNPIGLTLIDLIRVDGLRLHVRNIDLLDGTPILDIKPYLPAIEAFPNAHAGWIDEVNNDEDRRHPVTYTNTSQEQLDFLRDRGVDLRPRIERVLSRSFEPHPYKRIERDDEGLYLAYHGWRARFSVEAGVVHITEIRSGYSDREFSSGKQLADHEAQHAFRELWSTRG